MNVEALNLNNVTQLQTERSSDKIEDIRKG